MPEIPSCPGKPLYKPANRHDHVAAACQPAPMSMRTEHGQRWNQLSILDAEWEEASRTFSPPPSDASDVASASHAATEKFLAGFDPMRHMLLRRRRNRPRGFLDASASEQSMHVLHRLEDLLEKPPLPQPAAPTGTRILRSRVFDGCAILVGAIA